MKRALYFRFVHTHTALLILYYELGPLFLKQSQLRTSNNMRPGGGVVSDVVVRSAGTLGAGGAGGAHRQRHGVRVEPRRHATRHRVVRRHHRSWRQGSTPSACVVSCSRGPGRKPGASTNTWKRLSRLSLCLVSCSSTHASNLPRVLLEHTTKLESLCHVPQ